MSPFPKTLEHLTPAQKTGSFTEIINWIQDLRSHAWQSKTTYWLKGVLLFAELHDGEKRH